MTLTEHHLIKSKATEDFVTHLIEKGSFGRIDSELNIPYQHKVFLEINYQNKLCGLAKLHISFLNQRVSIHKSVN